MIEITSCQICNIIYYDNDISDNPTTLVSGEISLIFLVKFKFLRCCSSVIDRHRAGLSRYAKTAETANLSCRSMSPVGMHGDQGQGERLVHFALLNELPRLFFNNEYS